MLPFRSLFYAAMSAAIFSTMVVGCGEDKASGTDASNPSSDQDAAAVVAQDLGAGSGGATDEINDLMKLAKASPIESIKWSGASNGLNPSDLSYDAGTGTWTLEFSRTRGIETGMRYSHVERTYTWQFRKSDGQPQVSYVVGTDTAYSIQFNIVSGYGYHKSPRITQHLTALEGDFLAMGTNKNTIVINGNYLRSAIDTITTMRATRVVDHTLDLTYTDITIERDAPGEAWQNMSGAITGTYTADIEFLSGAAYGETHIERNIVVNVTGGTATIHIRGMSYICNLQDGELADDIP
jgi:hypothetical protein